MAVLLDRGFQGIRLRDLLDAWDGNATLPAQPVVLTFDDGYANFLESGTPVLKDVGFTATIFSVAGYAGRTNDWPSQSHEIPRLPLLNWSDLRNLARQGFEIGEHTMTHMPFPHLQPDDAQREIVASKQLLEDQLGRPVTTFAYPYGFSDPASHRLVVKEYRAACGGQLGVAQSSADRHLLKRIEVYYFRALPIFRMLQTPWGSAYLRLRGLGRACREAAGLRVGQA